MKSRCIKKPFDSISFCDRNTAQDVIAYNLDSIFLNVLTNKIIKNMCNTCLSNVMNAAHKLNKDLHETV